MYLTLYVKLTEYKGCQNCEEDAPPLPELELSGHDGPVIKALVLYWEVSGSIFDTDAA